MKTTSFLLSFAGLLCVTVAHGQESPGSTFPQPSQSPPLAYRHASTVHEGSMRGIADGIRAVGEMNYNNAAAALIFEEARKANYANELRHAETFWAKRHLYKSQMASLKAHRPVPVTVEKPDVQGVKFALPHPPIDVSQPGFVWPAAFEHPAFGNARQRMTALFAERTPANSGAGSPSFLRIQTTAAEMKALLSDLVRDLPPMTYVEGQKFLGRLTFEAGQPVVLKVAANN